MSRASSRANLQGYIVRRAPHRESNVGSGPTAQRKKEQKAAKPASKALSPAGLLASGYFDARKPYQTCITPLPSLGNYVPLRLNGRLPWTDSATNGAIFILNFSSHGVGLYQVDVYDDTTAAAHGLVTAHVFQNIVDDAPNQVRASRKTLTITSTTATQNLGGSVHVASVPQSISLAGRTGDANTHIDAASVTTLIDIAMDSPGSKQYSSAGFMNGLSFSLGFASVVKGSEWVQFQPDATGTAPCNSLRIDADRGGSSQVVVYWPKSAAGEAQSVLLGMSEQIAARYPVNHLLGGLAREFPPQMPASFQGANAMQAGSQGAIPHESSGGLSMPSAETVQAALETTAGLVRGVQAVAAAGGM